MWRLETVSFSESRVERSELATEESNGLTAEKATALAVVFVILLSSYNVGLSQERRPIKRRSKQYSGKSPRFGDFFYGVA